jgi:hypothetical protein
MIRTWDSKQWPKKSYYEYQNDIVSSFLKVSYINMNKIGSIKKSWATHSGSCLYNPRYLEGGKRRISVQGQPRQKLNEILSPNSHYLGGGGRMIVAQGWSGQMCWDPI